MSNRHPIQIERLEAAAADWNGTPFCERSAVKGAGVSCHMLAFVVYRDAGWLPEMEIPQAPVGWSRSQNRSLMEEWLDEGHGRTWFRSVASMDSLEPGDLLGFKIGHVVHHLGVMLSNGRIVSSVERLGVRISPCMQPVWRKRMVRVWRPIEPPPLPPVP
jgi:cell wall-associated NlpC family hydrolase